MIKYVLIFLSILAILALVIYTVASFYCLGMVVNRKKKQKPPTKEVHVIRAEMRRQNNQKLYERNPEDITIKSFDNLDMKAWFLPVENSKRFVICVHGYGGNVAKHRTDRRSVNADLSHQNVIGDQFDNSACQHRHDGYTLLMMRLQDGVGNGKQA
jgi:hypothetical protein